MMYKRGQHKEDRFILFLNSIITILVAAGLELVY